MCGERRAWIVWLTLLSNLTQEGKLSAWHRFTVLKSLR